MPTMQIFTIIQGFPAAFLLVMSEQIIKIEADPLDENCFFITLRELPRRLNPFSPKKPRVVVYKGYANNWYRLPDFTPAPAKKRQLLKAISQGPQFKHLRVGLHRRSALRCTAGN